jgi:hypothetical protein
MTAARAASPSVRFVLTHRVAFMLIERGGRQLPDFGGYGMVR